MRLLISLLFCSALLLAGSAAHAAMSVSQTQQTSNSGVGSITVTLTSTGANVYVLVFIADDRTSSPTASVSSFTGTAGLTFTNRYLNQNGGNSITCNQPGGGAKTCWPNFGYWCAFSASSTSGTVVANFSATTDSVAIIAAVVTGATSTSCASAFDPNASLGVTAAHNFTSTVNGTVTGASLTGTDNNDLAFAVLLGNFFLSVNNPLPCTGQGWSNTNFAHVQDGSGTGDAQIQLGWQAVSGSFSSLIFGTDTGGSPPACTAGAGSFTQAAGWVIVGDAIAGTAPGGVFVNRPPP